MANSEHEQLHEQWRSLCLSMPGAYEDHPFGADSTVFKIAGRDRRRNKMFALLMIHQAELVLNLKCEPAIAEEHRREYPQITPGYHMNKKHWNSIRAGLDQRILRELIEDSYDLVVEGLPKRDREFIALQRHIDEGSLD